jgi:hypothetical protein
MSRMFERIEYLISTCPGGRGRGGRSVWKGWRGSELFNSCTDLHVNAGRFVGKSG